MFIEKNFVNHVYCIEAPTEWTQIFKRFSQNNFHLKRSTFYWLQRLALAWSCSIVVAAQRSLSLPEDQGSKPVAGNLSVVFVGTETATNKELGRKRRWECPIYKNEFLMLQAFQLCFTWCVSIIEMIRKDRQRKREGALIWARLRWLAHSKLGKAQANILNKYSICYWTQQLNHHHWTFKWKAKICQYPSWYFQINKSPL